MRSSALFGWLSVGLVVLSTIIVFTPFEIKMAVNFNLAFMWFILSFLFNMKADFLKDREKENEKEIEFMKKEIEEVK